MTLLDLYDAQVRVAELTNLPAGARAERDGPITRVVGQHRRGFVSGPPDLRMHGDELDALIRRQRDFFARRGEAVEWKTRGHDLPADLPERLTRAGFVAEDAETVLIGEAERLTNQPALDGIRVREVTEDRDMQRIAEMASEVWGDDRSWLARELINRVNTVVVVAEVDGRVVSSARLVFEPGTDFAGLWGGSTLKEWRGRGIYRALVAHRAKAAVRQGTRYLQVDASEDSRPILERLGFQAITTTTPYVWEP